MDCILRVTPAGASPGSAIPVGSTATGPRWPGAPGPGVGYVIMINTSTGKGFKTLRQKVREFLVEGQPPDPLPLPVDLEPAVLSSYAGYYQSITPRVKRLRFLAPFSGMRRVEAGSQSLWLTPPGGERTELVPVSEQVFRRAEDPISSAVFYGGEEAGEAIFGIGDEYRRVPAALVWTRYGLAAAVLILMATTLLFALVWVPRLLFGRRLGGQPFLSVRVIPLCCTLSFAAAIGILAGGTDDPIGNVAKPTGWSVGLMVATILFALTALAGLCVTLISKRAPINRMVRIHSLLVTSGQVLLALYLAYWGIIAVQTWT